MRLIQIQLLSGVAVLSLFVSHLLVGAVKSDNGMIRLVTSTKEVYEWRSASCVFVDQKLKIVLTRNEEAGEKGSLEVVLDPRQMLKVVFRDQLDQVWSYDRDQQSDSSCVLSFKQDLTPERLTATLNCQNLTMPKWGSYQGFEIADKSPIVCDRKSTESSAKSQ